MRIRHVVTWLLPLVLLSAGAEGSTPDRSAALRGAFGAQVRVVYPANAARPSSIVGLRVPVAGSDAIAKARHFIARYRKLLGLSTVELTGGEVERSARRTVVRMGQTHQGVPVVNRSVTVSFDAEAAHVKSVQLEVADIDALPPALLTPAEAATAAHAQVKAVLIEGARPAVAERILAGPPARRVFQVVLPSVAPPGRVSAFIDARSGQLVWQRHDAVH